MKTPQLHSHRLCSRRFLSHVSLTLGSTLLASALLAQPAEPTPTASAAAAAELERGAGEGDVILATWQGGRLLRSDYQSWLDFREVEDTPAAIREMVFLESMAQQSRARGAEQELPVWIELETVRHRVLTQALRQHTATRVTVSDAEVEALYRENPDAYQRPPKFHLYNLYKRLPEREADAATVRARMADLYRQLLEGADFEQLARQESESQTRFRGGSLGFVAAEDLPSHLADLVSRLQPGQVSPPVEHAVPAEGQDGRGLTILFCKEVRPGRELTPEQVRQRIRERLLSLRSRETWVRLQEDLLAVARTHLKPESPALVFELPDCPAPSAGERSECRLSAEALHQLMAQRLAQLPEGALPESPTLEERAVSPEQREKLLRSWALGVLLARQAVDLGLDRQPLTAATLRWRHQQVLAQHELQRRVEAQLQPATEPQLRARYARYKDRYLQPAAVHLALVQFGAAEQADELQEAVEVVQRLEAGELDFASGARRYSRHPSAAAGGDLGWVERSQVTVWGATVVQAIRQLEPGQRSGLVHTDNGLWLFELRDRRDATELPFEQVRARLADELLQLQERELQLRLREQQLEAIGLEVLSEPRPVESAVVEAPSLTKTVRWSTASEFENFGYHVFRGPSAEGPFERLTSEPIPGAGTSDVPHSYVFEDVTAQPGVQYFYYVEALSIHGDRKRLTPIRPAGGGAVD